MVVHNGKTYTANDLTRIGNNLASVWGGACYSFTVDPENEKVIFDCIEHGEKFCSELSYAELQENL